MACRPRRERRAPGNSPHPENVGELPARVWRTTAAKGAHRGIHPTRKMLESFLPEFFRVFVREGHVRKNLAGFTADARRNRRSYRHSCLGYFRCNSNLSFGYVSFQKVARFSVTCTGRWFGAST